MSHCPESTGDYGGEVEGVLGERLKAESWGLKWESVQPILIFGILQ
jgi:hypothetical protein